jgi:hypothetical protein
LAYQDILLKVTKRGDIPDLKNMISVYKLLLSNGDKIDDNMVEKLKSKKLIQESEEEEEKDTEK